MAKSNIVTDLGDKTETPLEERFQFGKNWRRFLSVLDDTRIEAAERSFRESFQDTEFEGKTFLDIGSGSGLSSLVARRLGAKVRSFDFDPNSVGCTQELRRRYFDGDPDWSIEQGSVLDETFMSSLGTYDIVYSWGVLHHTGDMWRAIDLAQQRVKPGGIFLIALYNDCGRESKMWWYLKKGYCALPRPLQPIYAGAAMLPYELRAAAGSLVRGNPSEYIHSWTRYSSARGMSRWHDIEDWVGGFPYEVSTVERTNAFLAKSGFSPLREDWGGGLGCHEVLYRKQG